MNENESYKHVSKEFLKFAVIGALSTLINYGISVLFIRSFHVNELLSTSLGYILGFLFGFIFNRNWAFYSIGNYKKEILKYVFLYTFSLLVNILLVYISKKYIAIPFEICYLFVIGVTTILNFTGSKLFVFKEGNQNSIEINKLVKMSKKFGQDPDYVQGGGGNTSVKSDDIMYIKASGTALKNMSMQKGFTGVLFKNLLNILKENLKDKNFSEKNALLKERQNANIVFNKEFRPSIETLMHCYLKKYVMHLHPTFLNLFLCQKNYRESIKKFLKDHSIECSFTFTDFYHPGFMLAEYVKKDLDLYFESHQKIPDVIFLKNHGVIINCDEYEHCVNLTQTICEAAKQYFQNKLKNNAFDNAETTTDLSEELINNLKETFPQDLYIKKMDSNIFAHLIQENKMEEYLDEGILFPDYIVYCKTKILKTDLENFITDIQEYKKENASLPSVIYIKDNAIYILSEQKNKLDAIYETFYSHFLIKYLSSTQEISYLSNKDIAEIENMESEKYRRSL